MKHLYLKYSLTLLAFLLTALVSYSQVTLSADGPGGTYDLIESRGFGIETPDCVHGSFGPHVTEVFDNILNKNVFIFHSHATADNDRCSNLDRVRMEIKGGSGSPAELQHTSGQTAYYRWKFKLDAGFIPSGRFTHIFQIKAIEGDAGAPLITITPRAGNPQKMQIIHSSGEGSGGLGTVHQVDLAPFKGTWVEAFVKYKSSEGSVGTFEITLKRISDGVTLLSYSKTGIDMWRTGADYNRPKWGVYRGKDPVLRDEQVRFADFCVSESSATACPSDIGNGNQLPSVSITSPANNATFNAPASITINANAADADGNVTKVEFFNGATKLGEDLAAPYTFSWTSVAAGSYTLTTKATDNDNGVNTSSPVNVLVISGNQVLLPPIHDAYVRSGANAAITHGTTDAASLVVKLAPGTQVDNHRETYLTFDLSSINENISAVTLKLFGTVDGTTALSIPVGTFSVANTGWTESTITWNNKPAPSASALVSTTVTNGTAKYYTWNVTSYIQAERSAGRSTVSFALKASTASDPRLLWNSKETGSNPPQLEITTDNNTAPTVSITSPTDGATFNEGATVAIDASAADSDGSIVKVEFFVDGAKIGEDASSPYNLNWTAVAGTHDLTAKATDNGGAIATSAVVGVAVNTAQVITLPAEHDAYVRDGTNAAITHGTTDPTLLITKVSPSGQLNNARESYLTFDLATVSGTVTSVQLKVYGKVDGTSTPSVPVGVFPVATTTWDENTITWNNKPAAGATSFGTATVTNTAFTYYTWDVTSYVQSELAASRSKVSFAMKSLAAHDPRVFWNSSEFGSNPPQLVVTATPDPGGDQATPAKTLVLDRESGEGKFRFNNYPNPFSQGSLITFYLPKAGKTSLVVYDMMGKQVAVLANGYLGAGNHRATFSPTNAASGIYLLKLVHEGKTTTRKMIKE